jgi:hypothetical protein
MSKAVIRICDGQNIVCKVSGELLKGWLPGTIVQAVKGKDKKYITIDVASKAPNKRGVLGFVMNGSYSLKSGFDIFYPNQNEKGEVWTADENVKLAKSDENDVLNFDNQDKMLSEMGKGFVSVSYDGGCFKVYTFERYSNKYIETNGLEGKEIKWEDHIGELIGCSSRNLFTTLDNNIVDEPLNYRIAGVFNDENGKYILITRN